VRADATAADLEVVPLGQLTDTQGSTTQTGLIVVNRDDPARTVKDLVGYDVTFGPPEADEKHQEAMLLLASVGVATAEPLTVADACSDGACKVIDLGPQSKTATVISSYAQPLLEGCGTIKEGDLRVVGRTASVPFITAFASKTMPAADRVALQQALESAAEEPRVLEALESMFGFLPMAKEKDAAPTREPVNERNRRGRGGVADSSATWPGWRGPNRDGRVPYLPATLAKTPDIVWEFPLARSGLGGVAATGEVVIFGDRDLDDFHDVFRCLDADTGKQRWQVERLAIGALDYGNSPRATPLIADDRVFCLGAHGTLLCIALASGDVIWELDLRERFGSPGELPWGWCGSPLLVDGRLFVTPGTRDASVVALHADTGEVIWQCPGNQPSYGSFNLIHIHGKPQIVGYDKTSLGGWDPVSGHRIWSLQPPFPGDFNVPTPLMHNGQLLVATENNGTRRYAFQDDGRIISKPTATNGKLRPDMSTGVVVHDRLYCVNGFLYCVDLSRGLQELWRLRDRALGDYGSVFASPDRVLVIGKGTLLLLNADGTDQIIARQQVFKDGMTVYSHPAFVGNRLYLRGESKLVSVRL
ncbi:MAG: PQQ-binding-like beta-propeller repeat protein, partial [Planctomycetota bacterium]